MTAEKLIKALEKCDKDVEVFFEETQLKDEDGVMVGEVSLVNSVYMMSVEKDNQWIPKRIVLSNEE